MDNPAESVESNVAATVNTSSSGRLKGRVAVVTGGSSSIGRAISFAYAKEGAKVVVADIRDTSRAPSEADIATHELIRKHGGVAMFEKLDATKVENVEVVVKKTIAEFGRVDV